MTRFYLAENECIFMQHEWKVVTRVQITNLARAHFQNFVLTFDDVFHLL